MDGNCIKYGGVIVEARVNIENLPNLIFYIKWDNIISEL